jgi:hypothetical protein
VLRWQGHHLAHGRQCPLERRIDRFVGLNLAAAGRFSEPGVFLHGSIDQPDVRPVACSVGPLAPELADER